MSTLLLMAGCHPAARKPQVSALPAQTTATGIPACDNYLDHYVACHQAAKTYAADVLRVRYQTMRDTLLQEAGDPKTRPYMAYRCMGLARQLDESVGRACMVPAKPFTAPR